MDRHRSFLNITTSIIFKLLMVAAVILTRRCLIQTVGNGSTGLEALYTSLIGVLSVAELGVGSAISFCMYRPIVEGDTDQVAALYQLFRRCYRVIGLVILLAGVVLMPFLPKLARDHTALDVNLYETFALMLLSVVISYAYSAKTSLINAYKDNYITTTIHSIGMLLQYGLQIAVLLLTGSFVWYLACRIFSTGLQWFLTELIARRRHPQILTAERKSLELDTRILVQKNILAMFMHRIGSVLVNSADSVIVSAFVGVVLLGKYTNYTSIVIAMNAVIVLIFTPLTSIIGHLYVSDPEQTKKYFQFFHSLNFVIGVVFYLGYYAVVDSLILLLFGEGLALARSVSFVITVNYFIQFMRQSSLLFRDATGTFYNDRWKPLLEGTFNVFLSIAAVLFLKNLFGDEIGLIGVIVATIITNLIVCHIVEPYVLFRYAFKTSTKPYWKKNYLYLVIFAAALVLESFCIRACASPMSALLTNGGISLLISLPLSAGVFLMDRSFRYYVKKMFFRFTSKKT